VLSTTAPNAAKMNQNQCDYEELFLYDVVLIEVVPSSVHTRPPTPDWSATGS